jgi:putative membrane protein
MKEIALGLCLFVAVEHFLFLVLEIFFWTKPVGRKIFRLSEEYAQQSKSLAANQGLYNGFLAAGLVFSVIQSHPEFAFQLQIFFLACAGVAGIFGGITVSRNIVWVQAFPAGLALLAVIMAKA